MKVAPYLLARVLLCVRPGVPVRVTCRVAWKGTSRRVLLCVGLHQGSQIEFISFLLCPLPHSPLPKKHRANTPLGDAMCVSSNCTLVYTRAHGARSSSSHTGKHKSPRSEVLYWAAQRKPEASQSIHIEKGRGDARLPDFHGALVGWRCPTRILSWCASHTYAGGLVGGPTHCFAPFGSLLMRTWTASSPDSRDPKAASSSGALIWQ